MPRFVLRGGCECDKNSMSDTPENFWGGNLLLGWVTHCYIIGWPIYVHKQICQLLSMLTRGCENKTKFATLVSRMPLCSTWWADSWERFRSKNFQENLDFVSSFNLFSQCSSTFGGEFYILHCDAEKTT